MRNTARNTMRNTARNTMTTKSVASRFHVPVLSFFALLVMLGAMLALVIPSAYAFGVTSPYWDTKPLTLHPGESIDFTLILQNMVGDHDLTFKAMIVQGASITQLTDPSTTYSVPFGRNDVPVHVRVTVPNESVSNEVRELDRIGISFVPVTGQEGNMLQLGAAVKTDIPVFIGPWPPLEKSLFFSSSVVLWSSIILGLVVLLFIIATVTKKKSSR